MFFLQIIKMAIKGLRTNLLRSLMATLGVMIGVGAVVAAVSILEGFQKDILSTLESFGADQVLVVNGTSSRHGRTIGVNSLKPSDAEAITKKYQDLVKNISPQYLGTVQIKNLNTNTIGPALGATAAYTRINDYEVADGVFITREEVRAKSMVVVLGSEVARDLFGSLPAVGKSVKINGKRFDVIGVMEERGSIGFSQVDNQVIIPLSTAMERRSSPTGVSPSLSSRCAQSRP